MKSPKSRDSRLTKSSSCKTTAGQQGDRGRTPISCGESETVDTERFARQNLLTLTSANQNAPPQITPPHVRGAKLGVQRYYALYAINFINYSYRQCVGRNMAYCGMGCCNYSHHVNFIIT